MYRKARCTAESASRSRVTKAYQLAIRFRSICVWAGWGNTKILLFLNVNIFLLLAITRCHSTEPLVFGKSFLAPCERNGFWKCYIQEVLYKIVLPLCAFSWHFWKLKCNHNNTVTDMQLSTSISKCRCALLNIIHESSVISKTSNPL